MTPPHDADALALRKIALMQAIRCSLPAPRGSSALAVLAGVLAGACLQASALASGAAPVAPASRAASAAGTVAPPTAGAVARPALSSRAAASPVPAASAVQPPGATADGHHIIEDDRVRIDELRIRGEVRSITVQSKLPGVRPYEVLVRPGGRDPSQDGGAAGHSVWSLLAF